MKRKWLLATGLVLMLSFVLTGCVGGKSGDTSRLPTLNQQTGIWANGMGQIHVTPDIATLTLGIQAQERTVSLAQSEATAAMNKVMDALAGNGIDQKDIQTQTFSVQQVTKYDPNTQQQIILGFQVTNLVTVKIRALDKVGTIVDAVATAGGDFARINGITFSVEKPETYYDQLRQMAMADAAHKAEQLAQLGGVTLGRATYISESIQTPYPPPVLAVPAPASPGTTTPISAGQTQITLNVQVVYAIR